MEMTTTRRTRWHARPHETIERDRLFVHIDPQGPRWIATDPRGASLLSWLNGETSDESLVARYADTFGVDLAAAWLHVDRFVRSASRHGFVARDALVPRPYVGRGAQLSPDLRELWLHTTNTCNLTCAHCLVSSGPEGERGLPTSQLLQLVDEAAGLGVARFFVTGGEPFGRPDFFELVEHVTRTHGGELVVLTNGVLLRGAVLDRLAKQDRGRLRLQVSLDGATAATNDALRGAGTFERILTGIRNAVEAGFAPTLSTVVAAHNVGELVGLVRLAHEVGASSLHCLWAHRKGRWAEMDGSFVPPAQIHSHLIAARAEAERLGVRIDNLDDFRSRVNGAPDTRLDLSNAAIESVCVYADGRVFPSAATVQYASLELGRWEPGNLAKLLDEAPVARRIRELSVVHKPVCRDCRFRYLCGGGDLEHAYSFSLDAGHPEVPGSFDTLDPYCDLYQGLMQDEMFALAERGRAARRADTGFAAPVVYHGMGEGNVECAPGGSADAYAPVRTTHSNCVVSEGLDRPRSLVEAFYSRAAETPQEALCCPVDYAAADTAHIPEKVIERFYGCGGPMSLAGAAPGETVVDLGCGAGIDVFIAAKQVGQDGRAIGIDMTDPMLGVAGESRPEVARRLGYDVVEFRKGFLEAVPVEDESTDLVTSNCVINLSPDKPGVFREMWRVLKDHGRMVVSDIVAEGPVPPHLKVNVHLWGECVSGALAEDEFVAQLEEAGFFGLQVLKKQFWREVEGQRFFSVTVRGYKFRKQAGCVYQGHRAVYQGPWTAVHDEEGHLFPRGQAVDVCTDTVAKLRHAPYAGAFVILDPDADAPEAYSCGPGCC
jgi:radical SAM protein with 4Fe4S-binding SPASM domain